MSRGKLRAGWRQLMKPRTRRFTYAIMISAAVVFCGWWIIDRSRPDLQMFQNAASATEGKLSFTLTNPTTVPYHYWILIEFKTNHIWNIFPPVQAMPWEERKQLPPHQMATILISPPRRPGTWRIAASCWRDQNAPPTITRRVADFLDGWNLGWVADKFQIYDKDILVPGPEMPSETSRDQTTRQGDQPSALQLPRKEQL
jgi:hypothetical protein